MDVPCDSSNKQKMNCCFSQWISWQNVSWVNILTQENAYFSGFMLKPKKNISPLIDI